MPPPRLNARFLRDTHSLTTSSIPRASSICSRCLSRIEARNIRSPGRTFCSTASRSSAWAAAVSKLQNTVSDILPSTPPSLNGNAVSIDPLRLVGRELKFLNKNIRNLLGSGHPLLDTVAKYYTQSEGKHVRPMLVLLMSQATADAAKSPRHTPNPTPSNTSIDTAISNPAVLFDSNPDHPASTLLANLHHVSSSDTDPTILPSQRRLAEIVELIHTASLLHDDVIDTSTTRRSSPSANIEFGNKMAVLAGDFLLGRASVALARLRDPEVVELLATVIANLVEGEFMQLKNTASDEKHPEWSEATIDYYLQKTYLKSASLISKSCRAAALLGECAPGVVEAAYAYGRNLGLAFQLVDDMLDYTVSGAELGKPAGADLELGLATAPLLFAWRSRPELGELVGRRFSEAGDVQRVSYHKSPTYCAS
jgi:hexaprenyl-diphosphate synthase